MPDGQRPNGPRYDDDFYAWTQYQAEVLRSMRTRDNAAIWKRRFRGYTRARESKRR